ncbi:MAG: hypothetical protein WC319_01785 [Candidatus Paceibacterota bacterium]|jgi:hypothetical protein
MVRKQNEGSFGFAKRWLFCRAKTNVPECAVGFPFFFCLYAAKISLCRCLFFGLLVTVGGMKRWGLRATFLSSYTELEAGQNAYITT